MSDGAIKGRYKDIYKEVQLTKDGNLISKIDGINVETNGNKQRLLITNDDVFSLLTKMLKELKIIRLHMEIMSDTKIGDWEV